ncbi:MAG: aromatic ring-hydroxylating dioxygenase subunit alpha [Pseudomonadota bacterium]
MGTSNFNGLTDGLRDRLAAVLPPIETAPSLPFEVYSDEAVLRWEQAAIFRRAWIGLGRADQWANPGAYSALEVAGVPVIVLRDKQGTLRAFANACRHRGTLLLEGSGSAAVITCPFHRWTYGLDGRLRGAPDMDQVPCFDKADYGLVPFRLETRDGFAFLCFDAQAPSLDRWLGDFSALHAPWSLGDMVSTFHRELEVACNWKTFLEVFSEYYHLPYVHGGSIEGLYGRPDPGDATVGSYASQFSTTDGTGGLLKDRQDQILPTIASLEGRNRQGARYSWVFPNLAFAAGTESLWVYEAMPLAANRCRVRSTLCVPAETAALPDFEARAQHYIDRLIAVLDEDIPMLERQQKGLSTPYGGQGRFCTALEPIVANFAVWYARQMLDEA